jgi:hypothetical protein
MALDDWLRAMHQQFEWYRYVAAEEQVAMAAAHLRGPALDWWATLTEEARVELRTSLARFEAALRKRFQPVNSAMLARHALDSLQQGTKQSVHEHIAAFRRLLSAVPDMSEADRVHRFTKSLRPAFQARVIQADAKTLDAAITAATLAGALSQLSSAASSGDAMELAMMGFDSLDDSPDSQGQAKPTRDDSSSPVTRADLLQLLHAMQQQRAPGGGSRGGRRPPFGRGAPRVPGLTEEQVRKRIEERLCFICGQPGHRKYDCPENKAKEKKSFQ